MNARFLCNSDERTNERTHKRTNAIKVADCARHATRLGGGEQDDLRGSSDFPFGCQPQQEGNAGAAWFFVFFILVGVFIVMNLFVGAVVDKFNELKDGNGGKDLLKTDEQRAYCESIQVGRSVGGCYS